MALYPVPTLFPGAGTFPGYTPAAAPAGPAPVAAPTRVIGSGIVVPHLAWPLRQDAVALANVEQDTYDDVRQCVHVLMCTPLGVRPLSPDSGVEDPTFGAGVDADQLEQVLGEQEDRATVTVLVDPPDEQGEQQVQVVVALSDDPDGSGFNVDPGVA